MLTLYIVRHAKSSWSEMGIEDHDRKLNERGQGDLERMSKEIESRKWIPDLIISSTASRAKATARGIAQKVSISESTILFDRSLYLCTAGDMRKFLSSLENRIQSVMLVGHNPGITDFFNEFTDIQIDNVPTCAVGAFQSEANDWQSIAKYDWKSIGFIYPKM